MTLYRDDILEHWRHPQNFGTLEGATHHWFAENANCGDRQTMYASVDHGILIDVRFSGVGCAISMAASSLLTEYLKGKTISEAQELPESFMAELLGSVVAPGRVQCACLGLRALKEAVKRESPNF